MQAVAQNVVVGGMLVFLTMMLLRQVPVLGFLVRMAIRVMLLVSPIVLVVLIVAVAWFHGASLLNGRAGNAADPPPAAASPSAAPLPVRRPDD